MIRWHEAGSRAQGSIGTSAKREECRASLAKEKVDVE